MISEKKLLNKWVDDKNNINHILQMDKTNTCIIFDWDDTLCATTSITSNLKKKKKNF